MPNLPKDVPTTPHHIGEIGEAIFCAKYGPPEPVIFEIKDYCKDIIPDELSIDDINVMSTTKEDYSIYLSQNQENIKWVPDSKISTFCRPPFDSNIELEQWEGPTFPIEVKTGKSSMHNNQRETIEYLSNHIEDIQPIIVWIALDELPQAFTIKDIEFV